jgi:hypothetical protein
VTTKVGLWGYTNCLVETTCTVSTQNTTETANITLYPNPATTELHIRATAPIQSVQVFDMLGQQVGGLVVENGAMDITLPDFPLWGTKGVIYFVKVKTAIGEVVQRIIKSNLP